VRGANDPYSPSLAQSLAQSLANGRIPTKPCAAPPPSWLTSGRAVAVRNVALARRGLLTLLSAPGQSVHLLANATYDLVETVKRSRLQPCLRPLAEDLSPCIDNDDPSALVWMQPMAGTGTIRGNRTLRVLDHADTLPVDGTLPPNATAAIYGLHLSADPKDAGALVHFADDALAAVFANAIPAAGRMSAASLMQVWQHWQPLIARQQERVAQVQQGIAQAAGLHTAVTADGALPHGVLVQIPAECDAATFAVYALSENTPLQWLPQWRPLHPRALTDGQTASVLARWMLAPVGPNFSDEEVEQTVLGIVKAAEYLGVRWRLDPTRAAAYAALMDITYGPGHDAYRPAFATPVVVDPQVYFPAQVEALACKL
jgi:hypothetical protein